MRFIIVDDNSSTRLTVKIALEKMNHSIVGEAENYDEAVKVISETDFDILLLDLLIPGGSGVDVLRKVGTRNKKVIAITALEQDGIDKELMRLGVCFILRKPFSFDELKKAIEECV